VIYYFVLRKQRAPVPAFTGITADDCLHLGESAGILELAKLELQTSSVMADCAFVENGLTELLRVPKIKTGLHF